MNSTPWWSPLATDMLESYLAWVRIERPGKAFEWGSGGSTIWLRNFYDELVTVEHDQAWADRVERRQDPQVTLLFSSLSGGYEGAIDSYPDENFDLISIDGRRRMACFDRAIPKLRSGGILVLDDTQRPRYRPALRRLAAERWLRARFKGGPEGEGDRETTIAFKP